MVVIPKTVKLARITENLKATDLVLDKQDMKELAKVEKNFRILKVKMKRAVQHSSSNVCMFVCVHVCVCAECVTHVCACCVCGDIWLCL